MVRQFDNLSSDFDSGLESNDAVDIFKDAPISFPLLVRRLATDV